ncbi:hypothetical protein CMV_030476 [Castanea mollissima]|uniref:Uncharacterized protein n=1 Tax=Castanea mollissima TaxID=60419 RepID=A0A8J4V331_9ROSI|nr:hypothetical protein CMV_030476 [Castanea mollissima]
MMMRGLPSKLMLAVVVVLFLVGNFPATSTLIPYGGRKNPWHVFDIKEGLMKTVLREGRSDEVLNINSKKIISFRSLREFPPPPPSTYKSQQRSFRIISAPPPQIT